MLLPSFDSVAYRPQSEESLVLLVFLILYPFCKSSPDLSFLQIGFLSPIMEESDVASSPFSLIQEDISESAAPANRSKERLEGSRNSQHRRSQTSRRPPADVRTTDARPTATDRELLIMPSPEERARAFRERKLEKERKRQEEESADVKRGKRDKPVSQKPSSVPSRSRGTQPSSTASPFSLARATESKSFTEVAQESVASAVSTFVENCTLVFFHSNEYLLFLAPPRGFATVATWTAASTATFEVVFQAKNEPESVSNALAIFQIVLLAFSGALMFVDGFLHLLRRKKLIPRLTEARAIRLLLLVTFWLVVIRNALSTVDAWICSTRLSPIAKKECFYNIDSRNHNAVLFPLLTTFPFWHNFGCLLFLVLVEIFCANFFDGQPAEVKLSRCVYTFSVFAAFLALYWWREVEGRRRYFLVRRLASIEASKKIKMESLAQTLLSLAAPDQVHALLQGRSLRIESSRCTILVTEIDQYLSFRQQMDPYKAVRLLDEVFGDMELLRKSLRLQKLYFRGDVYIIAVGLQEPSADLSHHRVCLEVPGESTEDL